MFTSHQTFVEAFYTATMRIFTEHARLHESFKTAPSGTTADFTNRHPETRLTAFPPASSPEQEQTTVKSRSIIDRMKMNYSTCK